LAHARSTWPARATSSSDSIGSSCSANCASIIGCLSAAQRRASSSHALSANARTANLRRRLNSGWRRLSAHTMNPGGWRDPSFPGGCTSGTMRV
jgi:hypothetical protein